MGGVTLTLPRLGETMEEARVTAWLVAPGSAYRRGDVLMEVETDKTVVEVPAMADGVLVAQLVAEGETVALDQPFAEVEEAGAQAPATGAAPTREVQPETPAAPAVAVPVAEGHAGLRASPAARAAARRGGVDLTLVPGTGRNGRITAEDVRGQGGISGRAGTVVLLHGLFDSARGWRDLPQRLARAGMAVHAPDLPGHGLSTDRAETVEAMADLILPGLPAGRIALVGHSLGGLLAVRLAQRLGPRIARLVLIAPAGVGARINADFLDGMLAAETPAALARALSLLDAGPMSDSLLAEELSRLQSRREALGHLVRRLAHQGMQQIDMTADLERLAPPISVIWGTADRILDWQSVAGLPAHVAIHLVRGAGHLPHLVAPGLVTGLLEPENASIARGGRS
ncbi:alpha/beta fold hydrolase [Tabrizicola sp. YIM 78059]|uniref:alpha/beta fold hydrolase n=1 Tax=Tabrizicola sp. YIM 78059 TaxID=2529861 RepID=UPI001B7D862B|nr:alpha/beta fold hydrolase [Tabrizicola sp. YIM 78059]